MASIVIESSLLRLSGDPLRGSKSPLATGTIDFVEPFTRTVSNKTGGRESGAGAPVTQPHAAPSDQELLRLLASGDVEAFEMLYDRLQGGIYRFALRLSGSKSMAEDVTQDVFLTLIRDGHQYDPERGSVSAYLYGMARHQVLRRLERSRTLVPIADDHEDEDTATTTDFILHDDPLASLTRMETIDSVRRAVLALPAHYREAVVLCDLHEMRYEEAALVIGCAVGTLRSRLHRGRLLLIKKLRATTERGSMARSGPPTRCAV